jgi:hypothetical protein
VHARPHFHARYSGNAASVDFDGNVIAGSLPPRAVEFVREWRSFTAPSSKRTGNALDETKPLVDITAVEVTGEQRLRLTFADGTVGDVDFTDRTWAGVLEPLGDPVFFARAFVDPEAGTVAWPGGIDLAPEPLYEEARQTVR